MLIGISMVFLHIVDDFYLQGILAQMKQESYWKNNAPQRMYRHDYIAALFIHGLSWSISVHIPILIYKYICGISILPTLFSIFGSALLHACVDNLKANFHCINLVQDQLFHLLQLFMIWMTELLFL